VRYGKLRFPSCTPFHPPGAPLPWGGRREPCSRLLPAFGKSREDRFLPASPSRVSHGPRALARRAGSCLRALTPRAFSVPRVSGGSASGSNQRKRRLPARGLGASRRSVEAVRGGELREVASGCKAPGRFWRRGRRTWLEARTELGGLRPTCDLTRILHGKPRDALGQRGKQCPLPEAPKVQGAVRPEDRPPLPAVRRGVML